MGESPKKGPHRSALTGGRLDPESHELETRVSSKLSSFTVCVSLWDVRHKECDKHREALRVVQLSGTVAESWWKRVVELQVEIGAWYDLKSD